MSKLKKMIFGLLLFIGIQIPLKSQIFNVDSLVKYKVKQIDYYHLKSKDTSLIEYRFFINDQGLVYKKISFFNLPNKFDADTNYIAIYNYDSLKRLKNTTEIRVGGTSHSDYFYPDTNTVLIIFKDSLRTDTIIKKHFKVGRKIKSNSSVGGKTHWVGVEIKNGNYYKEVRKINRSFGGFHGIIKSKVYYDSENNFSKEITVSRPYFHLKRKKYERLIYFNDRGQFIREKINSNKKSNEYFYVYLSS